MGLFFATGIMPGLASAEVAVIVSAVVSFLVCFACFYFRRHWKKFRGHPAYRPHWKSFTDDRAGVASHSVGEGGMQERKDWEGGKQEDGGGEMVATYGNGGQSTEGDIDLSMIGLSQGGISPDQRLYVSMRTIPLADFLASIDKEGMDLDKESDVSGGTLLTWAAEFHRSDICRVLLERNADPLKKSRVEKMNALEWATRTPARGSDGAQERDQVISMLTKSAQ